MIFRVRPHSLNKRLLGAHPATRPPRNQKQKAHLLPRIRSLPERLPVRYLKSLFLLGTVSSHPPLPKRLPSSAEFLWLKFLDLVLGAGSFVRTSRNIKRYQLWPLPRQMPRNPRQQPYLIMLTRLSLTCVVQSVPALHNPSKSCHIIISPSRSTWTRL